MELSNLISKQPKWLQYAAKWLYEHKELTEEKISELAERCKNEANEEANKEDIPDVSHPQYFQGPVQNDIQQLRLSSIGEIEGVNSLAPSNPLEFEESNITVVYGANGSGKSSYVRLLKHVCGARHPGSLLHNVFKPEKNIQQARIGFKKDGEGKEVTWSRKDDEDKEVTWSRKEAREDLKNVHIFDHSFGDVFVDQDDKVLYEPPELTSIHSLIEICDQVTGKLGAEEREHPSKKPLLPYDYKDSKEGKWFEGINAKTSEKDIKKYCTFSEDDKKRLKDLSSSEATKKELTRNQGYIDRILHDVQKHLQQLSDKAYSRITALRGNYIVKKEATVAAAKQAFGNSSLEGIGLDTWKELWEAAREYSQEKAYEGREFPVATDDAVCVLCHQPLSEDAKNRFFSFEDHVKGITEREAKGAKEAWEMPLRNIEDISDDGSLVKNIDEAGMEGNSDIRRSLLSLYSAFRARKAELSKSEPGNVTSIPDHQCISEIKQIRESNTKRLEQISQENNKDLLNGLEAREWLSENRKAIEEEIERLQVIEKIQKAKKLADTTSLSNQSKRVAKELITEPFVKWFNEELKALNARVKVEIQYTRTKKGEVLHELVLVGVRLDVAKKNLLKKVLSEGEKKVVSIAAFLADISGKEQSTPIVFDDPTSSLDLNFEKAFAEKLCELSNERQVIVFTHRMPLLGNLHERENNVDVKYICKHEGVSGEPWNPSFDIQGVGRALEELIQLVNKLVESSKDENNCDDKKVSSLVKGYYTELRIICERVIEKDLLSSIAVRDRQDIRLKEIKKLKIIEKGDIDTLDKLIDECNSHMHYGSSERNSPYPNPCKLKKDIESLIEWRSGFNKRKNSAI